MSARRLAGGHSPSCRTVPRRKLCQVRNVVSRWSQGDCRVAVCRTCGWPVQPCRRGRQGCGPLVWGRGQPQSLRLILRERV